MPLAAAMTALAVGQIAQGYAANSQSKYNAKIYQQQADMVEMQKVVESNQYVRRMRALKGTVSARAAAAGFELGGSPAAVLIDSLTQMDIDRQISMFNLNAQKNQYLSTADAYKMKGKMALQSGYLNAFSTMLMTGADYGSRSGAFTRPAGSERIGDSWGVRMSGGVRYRGA